MRLVLSLTVAALLGGCGDAPAQKPYRTKAQRLQDAEIAVSKTPVPRTYRLVNGELQVIEFPVKDAAGWLDIQRCYVWRDAEYRQASLSCGPPPEIGLSPAESPSPRD